MAINKKQKQNKSNKKKDQNKFHCTKEDKKKLMSVHLFLLYKNLNENFQTGIEDISKIC